MRNNESTREPLAIIGMGCRFPGGVDDTEGYWAMLCEGRDGIVEVPPDRWSIDRFFDPDPRAPGKMNVRAGGFLTQPPRDFDAAFFGISPREAVSMDPQQRLLLEVTWEALEDAGVAAAQLAGTYTGVFMGGFMLDNMLTQLNPLNRALIGPQTAVGTTLSILANRLSYLLDLRGPSIALDTACSSSLVALHQACQSLWNGESSLALVGGVNLMLRPENPIAMSKGQFLAPDGRCKSFDARADGYGRGEGAGVVVLKPMAQALADGDRIHGLVCATGVNQDGRSNGMTAPNGQAQEALMRQVLAQAGVEPHQLRYVEAHGTGTALGDPIEMRALGAVVGPGRRGDAGCFVGSVKPNIGHLEAASGVAGLIKAVLCLRHRKVPPVAGLQTPNPAIPFDELGLRLPRKLESLPGGEGPAYAAINSFGYGGTNAHALLREPPPAPQRTDLAPRAQLLPVSARSPQALEALALAYARQLDGAPGLSLHDLCFSASLRRDHHDHRLAAVAATPAAMAEQLRALAAGAASVKPVGGEPRTPVFVFNGMGTQWWAMGRELLRQEAAFRDEAEKVDAAFRAQAGWSLLDELAADEKSSRVLETQIAQPATLLVQAGLVALLRSWGVQPAAAVGHSVGEVCAAYVAGALSLEDAVRLSHQRSRIQKKAAGQGAMLAVSMPPERIAPLIEPLQPSVCIAAINSPQLVTLAGDSEVLSRIARRLEQDGVFNRFLKVEVAYHSAFMDPLLPELREALAGLRPMAPQVPLYSTVSAQRVSGATHDAAYWCANVRQPVAFAAAMERLIDDGHRVFLEIGPHPALSNAMRECLMKHRVDATLVATLRRETPERESLLQAVGALHAAGVPVDWPALYPSGGRAVRLPAYPWQRQTLWDETPQALRDRLGEPDAPALLQRRVDAPQPCWDSELNDARLACLRDHCVQGAIVLPAAAMVDAALSAQRSLAGTGAVSIDELTIHQALVIDPQDPPVLRVQVDPARQAVQMYARRQASDSAWALHASAHLPGHQAHEVHELPLKVLQAASLQQDTQRAYRDLRALGLDYGPQFQCLRELWHCGDDEVLALVEAPTDAAHALHPAALDACLHALLTLPAVADVLHLPVSVRQVLLHGESPRRFWSHGRVHRVAPGLIEGRLQLCDDAGRVFAELRGVRCQAASARRTATREQIARWWVEPRWQRADAPQAAAASHRWVVFMDDGGHGEVLAARLESGGARHVVRVHAGGAFEPLKAGHYRIRRDNAGDMLRLWQALAPCERVAWMWGLDATTDPVGLPAGTDALHLLQALVATLHEALPRVYFMTSGLHRISDTCTLGSPAQATMAGLARVAASEYPELRCTMVDLDGRRPAISPLAHELLADAGDDEVALRADGRHVQKLQRGTLPETPAHTAPAPSLPPTQAGVLAPPVPQQGLGWHLRAVPRTAPGPQDVELHVHAATLHAFDGDAARSATGLRSVQGVVSRVGADVKGWREGDAFIAWVAGDVTTHLTLPADQLVALPDAPATRPHELAALLPLAEAHVALVQLANLRRGETLLVRGTGPCGPAVQVARRAGARVIVAAHDAAGACEEAQLQLPPDSADLYDQVMAFTQERGVDVVLHLGASGREDAALLAPMGRLVDIDDGSASAPRIEAPAHALSWSVCSLARMLARPDALREVLKTVLRAMRAGTLEPEPPLWFGGANAGDAVQAASSFAPVLLALRDMPVAAASGHPQVRADASYLVTGGLGGFGLAVARWLVDQGAQHLVLVGRQGAATPAQQRAVQALQARAAQVKVATLDIADEAQVQALVETLHREMPPLGGVLHAAGVLDDGLIAHLNAQRLDTVLRAKARGAWNLHRHTQHAALDFFVLFSSVSALIGQPGQGNYVAANAFVDALAAHRRAQGLCATSIHWGVLDGAGMAADRDLQAHLRRMGIAAFSPDDAMAALDQVLRAQPVQVGIADVDWSAWARGRPAGALLARFAPLLAQAAEASAPAAALRRELQALPAPAAEARLCDLLAQRVARLLRLAPAQVKRQSSLLDMGADSLVAMELQAGLREEFDLNVSTVELMTDMSLEQLARRLLARWAQADAPATPPPPPSPRLSGEEKVLELDALTTLAATDTSALLARIDQLSDSEVQALLATAQPEAGVQP